MTKLVTLKDKLNNKTLLLKDEKLKRVFFDAVFVVGFLSCLPVGAFPQYTTVFSLLLALCIAVSFFDDNFYLYTALFMYMRYKMLVGDTPVFRIYSYLMVIKFITQLPKTKFRIVYLPALFVFSLHCIFALGRAESMRLGLNALVDAVLIYIVLLKVLSDKDLFRKFMLAFVLGGVTSGVYGWTNADMTVDINVRGAGNQKVDRNFGSLGDPNFAGLYYCTCVYVSLLLKKLPMLLRFGFVGLFVILILQTASLSALLTLCVMGAIVLILKYRSKSFFILLFMFVIAAAGLSILLSVPQFRNIPAISGLIIRFSEKLSYISMGRLDLLTTDRSAIWNTALEIFSDKSLFGKLFGGSVITVMYIDTSTISIACHQSIIQALLDFGIIGTLMVYAPFLSVLAYRIVNHFVKKCGYADEDVGIMRIILPCAFLIFGMSVDFFVDWAYLFFFFV